MKTTKVYDLPTRLFHWLFAGTFLAGFGIAKILGDDSPYFSYHMLLGLLLTGMVGLRIIWGFVGSRYAKFSSFELRPRALVQYFSNLVTAKTARTLGHNPASSWAALAMMAFALSSGLTGYLMVSGGDHEFWEDIHELSANAFIIIVIAHVAGVILHMIRHRDRIGLSMLHGKKQIVDGQTGIDHSYRGVGILFLVIIGAYAFYLSQNYDQTTQSLDLFGNTLQLGDHEGGHDHESDH